MVAPALGSRLSHWTGDDQARHEAEGSLEATVSALDAAGVNASGEVGSDDPIQAADDALREFPANEIVFATNPEREAELEGAGRRRDRAEPLRAARLPRRVDAG